MRSSALPHPASRLGVLAIFGICGPAFFVAVVVLLPFFHPGYSSVDNPISFLLVGPYSFVLSDALFATGVGSLALAVGIRKTTRGVRGSLLGSVLVGLWALGFTLAGVVLTDVEGTPTETGLLLHGIAVGLAFVSAVAGILLLSWTFARDARWSSFYPLSLALGFAALVALIDMMVISVGVADLAQVLGPVARSFKGLGVIQRIFVGTVVLWVILASIQLRSITRDGSPGRVDEHTKVD